MVTGPPDFVGIGVQKAGTSWWYEVVAQHPRVHAEPSIHKERHYFDRFWDCGAPEAVVRAYEAWFPRPPGLLAGEWTPDYIWYPWVIPLLQRVAPSARLICLLRDPVDRYVSGLAHDERVGRPHEPRRAAEAFSRGLYASQLDAVLRCYDRSQLLVLQYERCVAQPIDMYRRTCEFLEIEATSVPPALSRSINPTRTKAALPPHTVRSLVERYEPEIARLVDGYGVDPELWPNFAT